MKLTAKQAREMGLDIPDVPKAKSKAKGQPTDHDGRDRLFRAACVARGIPEPVREYRFAPPRRWRFDYCWQAAMLALEIQGGIWTGGGHVRGKHLLTEHEKLNAAAARGWRVLFTTPAQVDDGSVFNAIRAALAGDAASASRSLADVLAARADGTGCCEKWLDRKGCDCAEESGCH